MEMYYGISGMGAVMHTINFRLHPEQIAYIINHAENRLIFLETVFAPLLEALQDNCPTVEKYIHLQHYLYNCWWPENPFGTSTD